MTKSGRDKKERIMNIKQHDNISQNSKKNVYNLGAEGSARANGRGAGAVQQTSAR